MTLKKVGVEFEAKIKKYQEQVKEAVASTQKGHAKIISALVKTEKAALNLAATNEVASNRVRAAEQRTQQAFQRTATSKQIETIKIKKAEEQLRRESIRTAQAQQRLAASMKRTDNAAKSQSKSIGGLTTKMGGWLAAAVSIAQFTQLEDAWLKAEVQIDATTDSVEESRMVQQRLLKTANTLGISYTDLANVFGRFKRATEEMGTSSDQIISVTENIAKALLLEGNSANEVNSVIIQLSQGLRAGVLAGDEFRAVSESSSIILKALSVQMGVQVKDLKKLGSQGKITAEVLIAATENMEVSGEALNKATSTWIASWERVTNSIGSLNKSMQRSVPISKFLKSSIDLLAEGVSDWAEDFNVFADSISHVSKKSGLSISQLGTKWKKFMALFSDKPIENLKKIRDEIENIKKKTGSDSELGDQADPAEQDRLAKLAKVQDKADLNAAKAIENRLSRSSKSRQSDLKNLEESKAKELEIIDNAAIRALNIEVNLTAKKQEINDNFNGRKKGANDKAIKVLEGKQAKELEALGRKIEANLEFEQKLASLRLAIISDFEGQKQALADKARSKEEIAFDKDIEVQQKEIDAEKKKQEAIDKIKNNAAQREVERIEARLERSKQSRQNDLENLEESLENDQLKTQEAADRGILSQQEANDLILQLTADFFLAKEELALSDEERLVARLERELEMYQELNNQKLISDEVLFAAKEKLEFEQIKTIQATAVKGFQSKTKLNSAEVKFTLEALETMSKGSEKAAKVQFFITKAQKLSEAVVGTAAGIAKAMPNFPLAIAVGLAGGAQIAAIASQSFGGGGGASASVPSAPTDEASEESTSTEVTTNITDISGGEIQTTRLIISLDDGTDLIDGLATRIGESKADGRT